MKSKTSYGVIAMCVGILFGFAAGFTMKYFHQKPVPAKTENIQTNSIESFEVQRQKDAETAMQTISGIYEFHSHGGNTFKIDLRSDGNGIFSEIYWENNSELARKTVRWLLDSNNLVTVNDYTVDGRFSPFKIENADLIDIKGNRWLRVR